MEKKKLGMTIDRKIIKEKKANIKNIKRNSQQKTHF